MFLWQDIVYAVHCKNICTLFGDQFCISATKMNCKDKKGEKSVSYERHICSAVPRGGSSIATEPLVQCVRSFTKGSDNVYFAQYFAPTECCMKNTN